MASARQIGNVFKEKLALKYFPIGLFFVDDKPANSVNLKKKGQGCIMPLIFLSASGTVVSIDENSTGYNCSAFYLGYSEWIFPGIEQFLSDGDVFGRECERFIKTPELAKDFISSMKPEEINKKVAVFKPLEMFAEDETPEIVIFFTNPDQISALIYLIYYDAPMDTNRVITGFASSCGSVTTLPLKFARNNERKAVWGHHDISARARLPKDIMTLTLPYFFLQEMYSNIDTSFLITKQWEAIRSRISNE